MKNNSINLQIATKKEQIFNFFFKRKNIFVKLAMVVAVLLVLLLISNIATSSLEKKYSEILHQSLVYQEKGDIDNAKNNLKDIYQATFAPSGVKALASLRYAGILLYLSQIDEALKVYQDIATTSRYDDYSQDLAALIASKIALAKFSEVDKSKQQEYLKMTEKLVKNSEVLKPYILEQQALLAIKAGDLPLANKNLDLILKDKNASQSLKIRVLDEIKLLANS